MRAERRAFLASSNVCMKTAERERIDRGYDTIKPTSLRRETPSPSASDYSTRHVARRFKYVTIFSHGRDKATARCNQQTGVRYCGEVARHETIARLGKRGGSPVGLSDQIRAEFVPVQNIRLELGLPIVYYDMSGASGFDNVHRGALDGIDFNARYKLLDRKCSPFALTPGVAHWARTDENTGERVENYGVELSITLKDKVFGALNLIYDPEITRQQDTGAWPREATLGFFTSITTQVQPGVFLGAETRYFRRYDGLDLSTFVGNVLFAGPRMYVRFFKELGDLWSLGFPSGGSRHRRAWSPRAQELHEKLSDIPAQVQLLMVLGGEGVHAEIQRESP
jgi:hypothetical protein